MDDGADQVEEHHPRNERQAGDARAGAALSASWRRLARKTRPHLPTVAHRAVRERLLLAFAPLRKSATSENQRRLLDEEASAEHRPGQGDHQTPEEVRMAMRGHLGVPGEGSCQIGQDSSPPVRFGSLALIAAVGLEGRCRPPLLDHFQCPQRPSLEVEGVDRNVRTPGAATPRRLRSV